MAAAKSRDGRSAPASDPPATPATPPRNPVRRWVLVVLAVCVVFFLYSLLADRLTPYTSQATLQAFIVRVAPEVAGRVVEVAVIDNQRVDAGQLLFRIDREPYQLAVERAEAQLAAAGQAIGANTAGVSVAEQRLVEAQANFENIQEQTARIFNLVERGIYPRARADEARAQLDGGQAAVRQSEAELERARQELGPGGEDNPQIREASANLGKARLDLIRTAVLAPSDGVVTNLQLALGQFAAIGQPALTFIDAQTIWVTANLRENSLENVAPGSRAAFVFDLLPGQVLEGRVESIGWGVSQGGLDPATGLPVVRNQTGWIRDPQRFPVRLQLDRGYLPGLRYGSQANVVIYTGDNPVVNALASLWIRIVSVLTYVS
jgi:multidrug resistance efflux pump